MAFRAFPAIGLSLAGIELSRRPYCSDRSPLAPLQHCRNGSFPILKVKKHTVWEASAPREIFELPLNLRFTGAVLADVEELRDILLQERKWMKPETEPGQ